VDVKPKNALVFNESDRMTIKWTDFGLSCRKGEPLCLAGSPNYLPPEILNPKCNEHLWTNVDPSRVHRWSSRQDWFSIGVSR
jgi:serine/threonine protein kinase